MFDEKKQFYQSIIAEYQGSELVSVLESYPDCGFYEVCQRFVDVGLNSIKLRGTVNGYESCFQYKDMDSARRAVTAFARKYSLNNIEEFISILKDKYPFAVSSDDKRKRSATIMSESYDHGMFFSFSQLPDDVFNELVKDISTL